MVTEYIVTRTPTISDGIVVRWYRHISREGWAGIPLVSASRKAVMVHGDVELRTSADHAEFEALLREAMTVQGRILNGDDVWD